MVEGYIDVNYENIFYCCFNDLAEALNYVERVKEALNQIKDRFIIHWASGGEDLLSGISVSFQWYFMDEDEKEKYEIKISFDPRIVNEVAPKVVEELKRLLPAEYRKLTQEEKGKALRLAYPLEYMKDEREEELSERLNDWAMKNIEMEYFSPSIWVELDNELRPHKLNISLECKTGDGTIEPYYDYPPDDIVISILKRIGWDFHAYGTMVYEYLVRCPKCGIIKLDDCDKIGRGRYRHRKCGRTIVRPEYVKGYKWIVGEQTIYLDGDESEESLKNIVKKLSEGVSEIIHEVRKERSLL